MLSRTNLKRSSVQALSFNDLASRLVKSQHHTLRTPSMYDNANFAHKPNASSGLVLVPVDGRLNFIDHL